MYLQLLLYITRPQSPPLPPTLTRDEAQDVLSAPVSAADIMPMSTAATYLVRLSVTTAVGVGVELLSSIATQRHARGPRSPAMHGHRLTLLGILTTSIATTEADSTLPQHRAPGRKCCSRATSWW